MTENVTTLLAKPAIYSSYTSLLAIYSSYTSLLGVSPAISQFNVIAGCKPGNLSTMGYVYKKDSRDKLGNDGIISLGNDKIWASLLHEVRQSISDSRDKLGNNGINSLGMTVLFLLGMTTQSILFALNPFTSIYEHLNPRSNFIL